MVWNSLKILNELGKYNIAPLLWIPGNSSEIRNQTADELARLGGFALPFIGPVPFCGNSVQTFKNKLHKEIQPAKKI